MERRKPITDAYLVRPANIWALARLVGEVGKRLEGRSAVAFAVASVLALPAHAGAEALAQRQTTAQAVKAVSDDECGVLIQVGALVGAMRMMRGGKRVVQLTQSSNATSTRNLFTLAGSPGDPVHIIYTVNSGIKVSGAPGVTTGALVAGSSVLIVNLGYIYGNAGGGGNGGIPTANGSPGTAGQDAINLTVPTDIDNTSGYAFGGGGGGGGGAGDFLGAYNAGGGGGGGGQGWIGSFAGAGGAATASGSTGYAGDESTNGAGGAGGNDLGVAVGGSGRQGGTWGQPGTAGNNSTHYSGGAGGAAGKAVALNGNSINWLGGNNSTQVKGAVS